MVDPEVAVGPVGAAAAAAADSVAVAPVAGVGLVDPAVVALEVAASVVAEERGDPARPGGRPAAWAAPARAAQVLAMEAPVGRVAALVVEDQGQDRTGGATTTNSA